MYLFMYTFSNKKSNSTALKLHKKIKIGEIIALEKKDNRHLRAGLPVGLLYLYDISNELDLWSNFIFELTSYSSHIA